MLWGDHGHGGFDSNANAYIQGRKPMNHQFEIMAIYCDIEDAHESGDWAKMRSAVAELRDMRIQMGIFQAGERAIRKDDADAGVEI